MSAGHASTRSSPQGAARRQGRRARGVRRAAARARTRATVRAAEPDAGVADRLARQRVGEAGHPARLPLRRRRRHVGRPRQWPFYDKDTMPLKKPGVDAGVRIVPGGSTIRDGAFVAHGVDLHAADVRQHRRLRRRGHADRLARAGRIVRADRRARAPQRRRADRRRARAGRRAAGHHRRRRAGRRQHGRLRGRGRSSSARCSRPASCSPDRRRSTTCRAA